MPIGKKASQVLRGCEGNHHTQIWRNTTARKPELALDLKGPKFKRRVALMVIESSVSYARGGRVADGENGKLDILSQRHVQKGQHNLRGTGDSDQKIQ